MKRSALLAFVMISTLFGSALPPDRVALAAEKSVQLTIPGCTT